jgi:ribose transport system permease protein
MSVEVLMAASAATHPRPRRRSFARRHIRPLLAYASFLPLLALYLTLLPRFGPAQATSIANQGATLAIAGMGQTIVVLTGGVDLSVGPVVALTNSVAASIMGESGGSVLLTFLGVLLIGGLCGMINGLLVAFGRLQPIVVTLATASIYGGLALFIRPNPGGFVPEWYTELLTGTIGGVFPASLALLALLVALWIPFRRTRLGVNIYAIGSSEGAAYMSGLNVVWTKVGAYTLTGILSALAGLFYTAQTATGDALSGNIYTLNSVAAVVLGGTSLAGGTGGFIGTIAGAYVISIIVSVLFFLQVSPFYQNVFQGGILLLVVALSSLHVLRIKNRLEVL